MSKKDFNDLIEFISDKSVTKKENYEPFYEFRLHERFINLEQPDIVPPRPMTSRRRARINSEPSNTLPGSGLIDQISERPVRNVAGTTITQEEVSRPLEDLRRTNELNRIITSFGTNSNSETL